MKILIIEEDEESISKLKKYFEVVELKDYNLEERVVDIIHKLGIPSHLKGYKYVKEAILILNNNIGLDIYRILSKKYKISKSNIERDIRYAIETGWNRGDWNTMEQIFGNSIDINKAKPTNLEFILTIVENMKL